MMDCLQNETNSGILTVLPKEILLEILKKLPYDDVSKSRLVCRQFDFICGKILNNGFQRVRQFHATILKEVKDSLPRRESERRKHYLYPKHDILQALDTRISLLYMTYYKYISTGQCCFIPGKVLDEIFRLLRLVKSDAQIKSSQAILQELRDISSMAMEYFDDVIAQPWKQQIPEFIKVNTNSLSIMGENLEGEENLQENQIDPFRVTALENEVKHYKNITQKQGKKIKYLKDEINEMKKQISTIQRQINLNPTPVCTTTEVTETKTKLDDNNIPKKRKIQSSAPSSSKKKC